MTSTTVNVKPEELVYLYKRYRTLPDDRRVEVGYGVGGMELLGELAN